MYRRQIFCTPSLLGFIHTQDLHGGFDNSERCFQLMRRVCHNLLLNCKGFLQVDIIRLHELRHFRRVFLSTTVSCRFFSLTAFISCQIGKKGESFSGKIINEKQLRTKTAPSPRCPVLRSFSLISHKADAPGRLPHLNPVVHPAKFQPSRFPGHCNNTRR